MPMLDLKWIRRVLRLMSDAGVAELELDDANEGVRLRLKRGVEAAPAPAPQAAPVVHVSPMAAQPAVPSQAAQAQPAPGAAAQQVPDAHAIESPMVGTFYRSSSPDTDPYVELGSKVGDETVVCIIEAMKVMNEIKAEVKGEIIEVLVENGEPVEYGQPLFLVRKG